jgi:hypothetical protein
MQITELLLEAGADPDVRATEDDSFLNRTLVIINQQNSGNYNPTELW